MTDRELIQQALEALERCVATCFDQYAHEQVMSRPEHFVNQNITALRERLAQPEQEPVLETVYKTIIRWDEGGGKRSRRELARRIVALYTAPPQRKPLTVEEIKKLIHPIVMADLSDEMTDFEIVRVIEAAHGIKGEA